MHSRFKKTLTALGVSVAAVAMSAAATGTAAASESRAERAATGLTVCVDAYFSNPSWNCKQNMTNRNNVYDVLKQIAPSFQDSISSVRNLTGRDLCFYEHNNYQGLSFRIPNGQEVGNLAGTRFQDAISSWHEC
jgi:hypothetical protein